MRYIHILLILILLQGCTAGPHDWVTIQNKYIGKKIWFTKPTKFPNAGKLVRGNFVIGGKGMTHVSTESNGDLLYHIDSQEIIKAVGAAPVGKCKYYYVVDPQTKIIRSWGYEKGTDPRTCRTFG